MTCTSLFLLVVLAVSVTAVQACRPNFSATCDKYANQPLVLNDYVQLGCLDVTTITPQWVGALFQDPAIIAQFPGVFQEFQYYWGNCCGAAEDCDANCTLAKEKSDHRNGYFVKCKAKDALDACCLAHDTCYPWLDGVDTIPPGQFICALPGISDPIVFYASCDAQLIQCAAAVAAQTDCSDKKSFIQWQRCMEFRGKAVGVVIGYQVFAICGQLTPQQ